MCASRRRSLCIPVWRSAHIGNLGLQVKSLVAIRAGGYQDCECPVTGQLCQGGHYREVDIPVV